MGNLLERAYTEAKRLPDDDQEALGAWLLAEIDAERRWDKLLAQPASVIEQMAQEALDEHRAGRTLPLDPDTL